MPDKPMLEMPDLSDEHVQDRRREDMVLSALKMHIKEEEALFRAGHERMEAIEADLRPIRKMYWAVVGSATVGAALLATIVFFYQSDRADFREMQKVLHDQGAAIKVLIASHQNLDSDVRREHSVFERDIEKLKDRIHK